MTDDALITEFRARMLVGRYGDRALMLPDEQTYHGLWSAFCGELVVLEDRFGWENPVVSEVRRVMQRLADSRPDAVKMFAMNTTEYGRR